MIYGMQIFTDHPGRVDVHIDRFKQATCALMEKQGIKVIGCWKVIDEKHTNQLVYMIAHNTAEELLAARTRFHNDQERITMVGYSEQDGPIIASSDYYLLEPADFSPLK